MCANTPTCCITAAQAGQRLDVAVGLLFPACSTRARRRLWDNHSILVNGKARPCGYMVRLGDTISACPLPDALPDILRAQAPPFQPWMTADQPPHIVTEQQELLFLYKPSGLHTAQLAGRGGPSLEALLPSLLPPHAAPALAPLGIRIAEADTPTSQDVRLVNRLDCGTSGIVVAARSAHSATQWQRMENAGLCQKHYLTLLCGHLAAPLVVRHDLGVDSRRVTKVLPTQSTNPLRHSRFTPVGTLTAATLQKLRAALCPTCPSQSPSPSPSLTAPSSAPASMGNRSDEGTGYAAKNSIYTVALCTISKGARHQIRAHASHAGFPLWGDSLYSAPPDRTALDGMPGADLGADLSKPSGSSQFFLLHHGRLVLSGAVIQYLPPWFPLLPNDIQETIHSQWPAPCNLPM